MGDFGDSLQEIFSNLVIDDGLFASAIVIHHREPENGPYGGYEEGTDGVYEDESAYATIIPDTNENRTSLNVYGDLKEGDVIMFLSGTQTIGLQDRVTFESNTYNVRDIKTFHTNDANIVKQVSMSRELDDS